MVSLAVLLGATGLVFLLAGAMIAFLSDGERLISHMFIFWGMFGVALGVMTWLLHLLFS